MTFYSCSGRGTLYIPVSSIVGALQSTDALFLNAQCSCRGVPVMSVVCAKQSLWYAEITIGCDMLNGKATNRNNIRRKSKKNSTVGGILSGGILSSAFCPVAFCPGHFVQWHFVLDSCYHTEFGRLR